MQEENLAAAANGTMKALLVGVDAADTITASGGDLVSLTLPALVSYCQARPELQHGLSLEMLRMSPGHTSLQITNRIVSAQPHVVGVSLQVWSEELLRTVVQRVAGALPEAMIVVGGPQVTARAEQLLRELPEIDLVVSGEGETAFAELLSRLVHGQAVPTGIAGTSWREDDGSIATAPPPPLLPLATFDELPSPYLSGATGPLTGETAYVETARGDGGSGLEPGSGQARYRNLDAVEQELSWLHAQGVRNLVFIDPVFNADGERAAAMLGIVGRLGFAKLSMQVRAELLEEQLVERLAKLKAALEIGFVSSDPAVCRLAGHELQLDRMRDGVRLLQKHGVTFKVTLLCGLPGDTFESFSRSLDEVLDWAPEAIEARTLQVLPGTRFHTKADHLGIRFDRQPPHDVVQTTSMPYADLVETRALAMMAQKLHSNRFFRRTVQDCAKRGVQPSTIYGDLAYQAVADGVIPLDELLDPSSSLDSRKIEQLAGLLPGVAAEEGVELVSGGRPPLPHIDESFLMGWEITRACNMKCPHCFTASTALPIAEDPPLDEARALLDQMAEIGVVTLGLSGGEPMLRRDLEQIIDYGRSLGITDTRVVSNGILATEKRLRSLKDAGLVGLQVSIDGPDAETHAMVRACKPRIFDLACAGVSASASLGLYISIGCFLSRWTCRRVAEMAELTRKLGARVLRYCAFMPRGRGSDEAVANRVAPTAEDLQVFLEQLHQCQQEYDDMQICVDHGFGPTPREPEHRCYAGLKLVYLEANGDLYPCPGLIAPPFLMGNVHTTPLAELMSGPEIQRTTVLERIHLREPCCSCSNPLCNGGCRGMAWTVHNEVLGAFPGCMWHQLAEG